eukprot:TRINITY_DN2690_c0_g1_i2.p1 TRINITY_DN2690_c0_g1~~TRINITY_DN2690_c0_g1_i2.p1  ORF type:complete len:519 (-),score=107.20 TRINITY_DN2690_c0_g1_i2:631-2187(-)
MHGEKMRNQPQYSDGDVVGVSVDMGSGDIQFFLNGACVISWRSALRGPCFPFACMKHTGPAAILLQYWLTLDSAGPDKVRLIDKEVVGGCAAPELPLVDGSLLEGGGQVLRVALAFGALLGRPLHVHSIRAGRTKPGLGHQHSTGAKLVADLCDGLVRPELIQYGGHCEGSSELFLWPGVKGMRGGEFMADTHTAGAVTLLLQAALPCALVGPHLQPVTLTLRGGTNVRGSPSVDYVRMVLFPLLCHFFGVPKENLGLTVRRRGFYPAGGGEVVVTVVPARGLTACTLVNRGAPVAIEGVAYGGGAGGLRAARDAVALARKLLHTRFGDGIEVSFSPVQDEQQPAAGRGRGTAKGRRQQAAAAEWGGDGGRGMTFKERRVLANEARERTSGAAGMQLVLRTTTGCLIAGDSLIESSGGAGVTAAEVAEAAVSRLAEAWDSGGCVCEYTMDQLAIFMALAQGHSRVLCPRTSSISSQHLPTAIHFTQLLCGVQFVVPGGLARGPNVVECDGIGFARVDK